jgi:hypothetical protein
MGSRLPGTFTHVAFWAVQVTTGLSGTSPEGTARRVAGFAAQGLGPGEPAEQSRLLRDVIGNPYRRAAFDPAWRAPAVVALPEAAYQDRRLSGGPLDPVRLAVLADALEEAGCDSPELPGHLRGPGPHVRGCWVLDLLLVKE